MQGISRIDSNSTHGWYARVYYGPNDEARKMFSDNVHGGRNQAWIKANQWRDAQIEKRPIPKHLAEKMPFKTKPISTNSTGVSGVSKTFTRSRGGRKLPVFQVSWYQKIGVPKNKRFYIEHYETEQAALKEAVTFRRQVEQDLRLARQMGQR